MSALAALPLSATAIDAIARPMQLKRGATGAWIEGEWQPDAGAVTVEIFGHYQPTTTEDAEFLPGTVQEEPTRTVWTREPLQDGTEVNSQKADQIVIEGETWQVARALPRTEAGFTKAFCRRVGSGSRSG